MSIASTLLWIALAAAPQGDESVESAIRQTLDTLPGKSAMLFAEIADTGPQARFAVRDQESFAIGSSFKLFIFGTLVDEVNAGRRRLDDSMLLRRELAGPPASEMAAWPPGSPVTLHTLALKMISVSDNTATDHLHYLLGRERIEGQMSVMGHSNPAVNRPLLTTREMTMLRDKRTGLLGRKYRELSEPSRRRFLAEHFQGIPDYESLDFDTAAYDVAEWYASPLDMAKALDWIYRHTSAGQLAHPMRAILGVETKLPHDAKVWKYVGFKGGSEDQLLAGNWLLEHASGKWYTYHVYWNSGQSPAKPTEFVKALEKIFALIQAHLADPK